MKRRFKVADSVAGSPDAKQVATALVEIVLEVDHLYLRQRPRELIVGALAVDDRHDSSFKTVLLKGKQQFPLDPHRCNGCGGKNQHKPIAAVKSGTDFVVPLLSAPDIRVAVPDRNPVPAQHCCQLDYEGAVGARMGQKYFVWPAILAKAPCSGAAEDRIGDWFDLGQADLAILQLHTRHSPKDPWNIGGAEQVRVANYHRNKAVGLVLGAEGVLNFSLHVGGTYGSRG